MKKNMILTYLVVLAMVFQVTMVYSAALTVDIDTVKVDGEVIGDTERVSILRGETLDIKVKVTGTADSLDEDAVRVTAMIEGYDSRDSIMDRTDLFDVKADTSYYKNLDLEIPADLPLEDTDDDSIEAYKLRIIVSDRYSDAVVEKTYDIDFDSKKHDLEVRDITMSPENMVRAGNYLTLDARIKNTGTYDQDDVKVEFSIPELGLKEVQYIDEIESYDEVSTDPAAILIPACAENKGYEVQFKVYYHREEEVVTESESVVVLGSDSCDAYKQTSSKESVVTMAETVTLVPGKTVTVPILIQNKDSEMKTFVASVTGAESFGTYKVDKNSAIVAANGVATFNLMLDAQDNLAGDYAVTVSFVSGSEVLSKVLYVSVKAPVVDDNDSELSSNNVWNFVLIGAIVILVVLILVLLIRRFSGANEESDDEEDKENYY